MSQSMGVFFPTDGNFLDYGFRLHTQVPVLRHCSWPVEPVGESGGPWELMVAFHLTAEDIASRAKALMRLKK